MQVFQSTGIRGEARTVGTAGAVGAIIGGLIDGLSGALIGLPAGSIIRIRINSSVEIR